MKSLKKYTPLAFLALFFSSCKNDLNLNAPYKEVPSIYAILNPDDSIQMIRVNKVFLGETDANVMAKVSDSVNYQPGEITVTLERYLYGTQVNPSKTSTASIIVFTESVIKTQEGAFNTNQRVYVTNEPLFSEGEYRLKVKNNHTGNEFTASANAISKINKDIQISSIFNPPYYPYPADTDPDLYIDYSLLYPKYNYKFRFYTNEGMLYKVTFRLHFYDSLYSGNNIPRYVDYTSGNIVKKGREEKEELVIEFRGADIYNAAAVGLSKMNLSNEIVWRKMYKIEYIINTTTQEYIDYLQYSSPSLSINQNKPLYSNFKDGKAIGIFTFRTTFSMSKNMSTTFVDGFADYPGICYKFRKSNGVIGCPN